MKRNHMLKGALGLGLSILSLNALATLAPHVPGEIIVKFKKGAEKNFQATALGAHKLREIPSFGDKLAVLKVEDKSLENAIERLNQDPSVEYAEPNFIYSVNPIKHNDLGAKMLELEANTQLKLNYTPSDPRFGELWGLKNTGSNEPNRSEPGLAGADIDAIKAWGITRGDRGVKIAVIDTGIDYNHPDLRDNMWVNMAEKNGEAGVDDDGNGYIDDIHGYDFANNDGDPIDGHSHGTHCAGTIGAVHNNGEGVAGVMNDVTFVAVKFLTDAGSGTTENAVRSIDYATKVGVDLMSNSWGGGGFSQALKESIERASAAGIIFTAAAGNSRSNNDVRPHYPSNYDVENVVSVAASTAQDGLASFSCYGRRTVHIAAPGHRVLSTTKRGGYAVYSGTSMATPHVSGALGLLLAQEGRMPHSEMRERLMATSEPISAFRGKTINGGRLNALNLLNDFRPERNEPKPGDWQRVDLDEVWESEHPYGNNLTITKTFTVEGAKYMRLKVNRYELENRYDYLEVKEAGARSVEKISGNGTNYASDWIEGDTMTVTFRSDRSVTKWGFLVDHIEVQYEDEAIVATK